MLFLVCSDSVAVAATNFAFGNFFVERLYAPAIANASADVETIFASGRCDQTPKPECLSGRSPRKDDSSSKLSPKPDFLASGRASLRRACQSVS